MRGLDMCLSASDASSPLPLVPICFRPHLTIHTQPQRTPTIKNTRRSRISSSPTFPQREFELIIHRESGPLLQQTRHTPHPFPRSHTSLNQILRYLPARPFLSFLQQLPRPIPRAWRPQRLRYLYSTTNVHPAKPLRTNRIALPRQLGDQDLDQSTLRRTR